MITDLAGDERGLFVALYDDVAISAGRVEPDLTYDEWFHDVRDGVTKGNYAIAAIAPRNSERLNIGGLWFHMEVGPGGYTKRFGWTESYVTVAYSPGDDDVWVARGGPYLWHNETLLESNDEIRGLWTTPNAVFFATENGVMSNELPVGAGWLPDGYPRVQGTYHAIHGVGQRGFAVGAAIAHYNGQLWDMAVDDLDPPLDAVSAASPDDVWAVGEGGIAHFDGSAWYQVSEFGMPSERILDVVALPDGNVWFATSRTLFRRAPGPAQTVGDAVAQEPEFDPVVVSGCDPNEPFNDNQSTPVFVQHSSVVNACVVGTDSDYYQAVVPDSPIGGYVEYRLTPSSNELLAIFLDAHDATTENGSASLFIRDPDTVRVAASFYDTSFPETGYEFSSIFTPFDDAYEQNSPYKLTNTPIFALWPTRSINDDDDKDEYEIPAQAGPFSVKVEDGIAGYRPQLWLHQEDPAPYNPHHYDLFITGENGSGLEASGELPYSTPLEIRIWTNDWGGSGTAFGDLPPEWTDQYKLTVTVQ